METSKPSPHSFELDLRVSHVGFGISEAYIVYNALGDYAQHMMPHLLKYYSEGLEHDEYDDTLHALSVIDSARNLQDAIFMKLLDMAENNAHPDRQTNLGQNRQREAEQETQFRELFKMAIPHKGGEGHE